MRPAGALRFVEVSERADRIRIDCSENSTASSSIASPMAFDWKPGQAIWGKVLTWLRRRAVDGGETGATR